MRVRRPESTQRSYRARKSCLETAGSYSTSILDCISKNALYERKPVPGHIPSCPKLIDNLSIGVHSMHKDLQIYVYM
jgi:hypothetical protein